jgi:hypothetical protein
MEVILGDKFSLKTGNFYFGKSGNFNFGLTWEVLVQNHSEK